MPFGNEPEDVLTRQEVWLEAEHRTVSRAGINNPKIAVEDEDRIWRGSDPGGEDVKHEAPWVSGCPLGVQDAGRGSPSPTGRLLHQPAQAERFEVYRSGPRVWCTIPPNVVADISLARRPNARFLPTRFGGERNPTPMALVATRYGAYGCPPLQAKCQPPHSRRNRSLSGLGVTIRRSPSAALQARRSHDWKARLGAAGFDREGRPGGSARAAGPSVYCAGRARAAATSSAVSLVSRRLARPAGRGAAFEARAV